MTTPANRLLLLLPVFCAACSAMPSRASGELHALFEREWEQRLDEDPLLATSVGDPRGADALPSVTASAQARRAARTRRFLEELGEIDLARLSDADRVSAEVFRRQLGDRLADYEFGAWQIPFTADDGFHIAFARLPEEVPLQSVSDYENYVTRLRAFPAYVDQQVTNMRVGLERGMTMPRVVLDGYEVTIRSHVVEDPAQSLFFEPFRDLPASFTDADRTRLVAAGRAAILQGVVPGYRRFLDFMVDEYMPATRTSLGASELPGGRRYYEHLVRHFTTLDVTPAEVHAIGLEEVARIRAAMQAVIERTGFEGELADFLTFLRTDPRFYAETPEELLATAAWICKRMDAQLPALFGELPRLPYGVAPVPEHLAPKYTAGRYVPAPEGSREPGYYWVNTYALESRPLYLLPALSLHEAVPGHHLQNSLAREQADLPEFRRHSYLSAYGEGWALYSEWLGLEAGIYQDPYDDFGRLTYEMWRACRLVVDTGLHAMGWTREQAMDYLAGHTALSLHEVRTETDRYISWPGQALSYKMGELEIRRLRAEAEATLGAGFDVRAFHDTVLACGSVPLGILREAVEAYIEEHAR